MRGPAPAGEGSINQFGLPWAVAFGEPVERVLSTAEFEAWSMVRMLKCGHKGDVDHCRWCQGTMLVAEALGMADSVKILPMR